MSKNELNVCRGCNSNNVIVWVSLGGYYTPMCLDCDLCGLPCPTKKEAIEAWNAPRVPDPRLMKVIEEIEKLWDNEVTDVTWRKIGYEDVCVAYKSVLDIIHKHLPETKESK